MTSSCCKYIGTGTKELFWDKKHWIVNDSNCPKAKFCLILFECIQTMLACGEASEKKLAELLVEWEEKLHASCFEISAICVCGVWGFYLSNIDDVLMRTQVGTKIRGCITSGQHFFACSAWEKNTLTERKQAAAKLTKNEKQRIQRQKKKSQSLEAGASPSSSVPTKKQRRLEAVHVTEPLSTATTADIAIDYSCFKVDSDGLTSPAGIIRYSKSKDTLCVGPLKAGWELLTLDGGSYGIMLCNKGDKLIYKCVVVGDGTDAVKKVHKVINIMYVFQVYDSN